MGGCTHLHALVDVERVHRETSVRHESVPFVRCDAKMLMSHVHRLPGIPLRAAGQVAADLGHEELEALPLAGLGPRRDLGVGVERRVGHPRVHQAVGELGNAEDAADAALWAQARRGRTREDGRT